MRLIFASATFKQKLTSDVFINSVDVLPYIVWIVLCLMFFGFFAWKFGRPAAVGDGALFQPKS
jgi:hypothetical protein